MTSENKLLEGSIIRGLTTLAFPIMGTSFLQMAYNMVDMIWIGRLGASSVAAVGTAGFFMWLSFALIRLAQIGTEVRIAQSIGAKRYERSNQIAVTAIGFTVLMALTYGGFILLTKDYLIGFFNLGDVLVEGLAKDYLSIVAMGMAFNFLNPVVSGIFNGAGNSTVPFRVNSIGLVLNLVLDPLFIFGFDLGVKGAAYATILSQGVVTVLFFYLLLEKSKPFASFTLWSKGSMQMLKEIVKISYPVAIQSGLFTIFSILIARVIAVYGPTAIAVQKVGTQLEAISYMTAHGFGTALSAFTGQNLGAGKFDRVKKGFLRAGLVMGGVGLITSTLLFLGAGPIFGIFLREEPALSMGIVYLQILSVSQLFMCIEITLSGGFNGLGLTLPPSIISIIFTGLRVPVAYLVAKPHLLGLNGVWWTISMSSVIKGLLILMALYYLATKGNFKKYQEDAA